MRTARESVRSVASLATYINGYPFKPDDLGSEGVPVVRIKQLLDSTADFDYHNGLLPERYWLADGDLVFSWSGSLAVRQWDRGRAYLNQHLFRVQPTQGVDKRWLKYALEQSLGHFESMRNGSAGMSHITLPMLKEVLVPCPLLDEQRRIADFLDDQVARIARAVDARERQRTKLTEALDSATAAEVVALIGSTKMERLRYVLQEVDERAGSATPDELLSVSIHLGVVPRTSVTDDLPRAEDLGNYKRVRKGDLVLNRMRAFQGAVGISPCGGVVSPDYAVLRCAESMLPTYAHVLFRSGWFVGEMVGRLRGIGSTDSGQVRTPRINVEDLKDIRVPVPHVDDQQILVQRLGWERRNHDQRQDSLGRSIGLLIEYKRSLITAAVTGEFDVTTARTGVPA